MYIKLGDTNIRYNSSVREDYMIIGEIIDSPMSYQSPTLVRSIQDLDIWFSKSFPNRNYLKELLNSGNTLYLYKPVSTNSTSNSEDFVDYSKYNLCNLFDNNISLDIIENFLQIFKDDIEGFKLKVLNKEETNYDYYIWSELENKLIINNSSNLECLNEDLLIHYSDLASLNLIKSTDNFKIPYLNSSVNFWIWNGERFVTTSSLTQNLNNSSESLNNRDVLRVCNLDNEIAYAYPNYDSFEGFINNIELPVDYNNYKDSILKGLDLSSVDNKQQTLVFEFNYDNTKSDKYFGYVVFINPITKENSLIYNSTLSNVPIEVIKSCTKYYKVSDDLLTAEDFAKKCYQIYSISGYSIDDSGKLIVYSKTPIKVTDYYQFPGLKIIPRINRTYKILSTLITDSDTCIDFWSKTIGTTYDYDEKGKIKVQIEKVYPGKNNEYTYQITISRYNYSEVFIGSINSGLLTERLDYQISNNSKLVYCNIQNQSELRTGEFYLRGARVETAEQSMWKKSLEVMFNDQDNSVYPDFFLIPNITKFDNSIDSDTSYFQIYEDLLNYSEDSNCQFLIQNSDSYLEFERVNLDLADKSALSSYSLNKKDTVICFYDIKADKGVYYLDGVELNESINEDKYKILLATYGNDAIYNYVDDDENRLVYFFRPMIVNGVSRPGYYLFLKGLFNNIYSISSHNIQYRTPVSYPYEFENEPMNQLEGLLIGLKSNYLVNNNISYYYKTLQNGEDYYTTIWMRFILGKISRELQKNKGQYLGERKLHKVQEIIENILKRISKTFSIVKNIDLTEFSPDLSTNSLNLGIDIGVKDLVDNNLTIDLTLDYYENLK